MKKYTNEMRFYKYNTDVHISHHKRENQSYKTIYSNDIMTFDIEVSSGWLRNGKVIGYEKGRTADYWNNLIPIALCYIWQFSCNGKVYYGRDLKEFLNVLNDIPKDINCIIWVHNLAYEFQFLRNILTWNEVFARNPRKPIKCKCKEYPNIEFRCSYMLHRLSLEEWGKQLKIEKMVGDLDYEKLRTPYTKLTKQEMHYCEMDCLVLESGIKSYLDRYGTLRNIPLTQTGTVRRVIKDLLTSDAKYVSKIKKLVPKSAEEYKRLQTIFSGGYTHANRYWAGQVIEDYIEHYDFASSYPTVMIAEKFPMTPWAYIGHELPDISSFEDNAYILDLTFSQLNSTSFNTYIQASKSYGKNMKLDNGRVISAEELTITITEQDFITINNNYEWSDIKVNKVYQSTKGYLPKVFIEYILELYKNKTSLKDVEGSEDIYMQSKQYINALFGMCVTAIVQADVIFDNEEKLWKTTKLTKEYVEHKLNMLSQNNPREKRYFLSYSWGCWITAYARRNLWKCIEKCDHDMIYCDTDSIFVIGKHDFSWYNEEITNKLKRTCKKLNIDFNKTKPKTPKGNEAPLGIFTQEKPCNAFITLGAKRYLERRIEDNKLYMTISGINKESVKLLDNDMYKFADGFEFDKDDDSVKKRLTTYIEDMPETVWEDGYISKYKYGINLRRTGYKLSMTDEYKDLINYLNFDVTDFTDETFTKMRGYFEL